MGQAPVSAPARECDCARPRRSNATDETPQQRRSGGRPAYTRSRLVVAALGTNIKRLPGPAMIYLRAVSSLSYRRIHCMSFDV